MPKTIAQFLSQFLSLDKVKSHGQNYKTSLNYPDLIFLINFNDLEYACIEYWLNIYREELDSVQNNKIYCDKKSSENAKKRKSLP